MKNKTKPTLGYLGDKLINLSMSDVIGATLHSKGMTIEDFQSKVSGRSVFSCNVFNGIQNREMFPEKYPTIDEVKKMISELEVLLQKAEKIVRE